MKPINEVVFGGVLYSDPREFEAGRSICLTFLVKHVKTFQGKEYSTSMCCKCWNRLAEDVKKMNLKEGDFVIVEGELRNYKPKDKEYYQTEISVSKVEPEQKIVKPKPLAPIAPTIDGDMPF